jgi:hypothetical protein
MVARWFIFIPKIAIWVYFLSLGEENVNKFYDNVFAIF